MSDFRLASIDWGSVRLLHGDHLKHETAYLENLARWVLHHRGAPGLVRMDPDSLSVVQSSATTYRVTLRRCRAVTPMGYWVHIDDDDSCPTLDLNKEQHLEEVVGLYVGVDTQAKEAREHAPAVSSALLESRSHWPRYVIGQDATVDRHDWLQIAQITNVGGDLVLDRDFIPPCSCLGAHPALVESVRQIRSLASEGLKVLSSAGQEVQMVAGAFASAIAPAATLVDWQARPADYIERIASALRANGSLATICQGGNPYRDDVISRINDVLGHTEVGPEDELLLGPALGLIRRALEVLVEFYKNLVALQVTVQETVIQEQDEVGRIIRRRERP